MGLSVKDRGAAVGTFRYVHVELMEMLAQWTPTSPEMEMKLLLGEHIWDVAQHADALGKRANELRLPLQRSIKPVDAYVRFLAEIRKETDTARRLAAFYDALLPSLGGRYAKYLEQTDSLMDAPTVRILEQMRQTQERMIKQSRELRTEQPALGKADRDWLNSLASQESRIENIVAPNEG
jgi:hypothetical protein